MLEKLLALVDIPLPEAAVAEELKARRDSIEQQLAYAGMTEADYLESEGQTAEEFAADLDKRVRDAMAAQFLLDEIATAESLDVDEGELTQHMLRRAQQSGQEPQAYIQHAMEHNHVPELVAEVRRGKALAHVVESATVKDSAGELVELKTLQPDGTYADPAELEALAAAAAEAAAAPSTDAAAGVVATGEYLDARRSRRVRRRLTTPTRPTRPRRTDPADQEHRHPQPGPGGPGEVLDRWPRVCRRWTRTSRSSTDRASWPTASPSACPTAGCGSG